MVFDPILLRSNPEGFIVANCWFKRFCIHEARDKKNFTFIRTGVEVSDNGIKILFRIERDEVVPIRPYNKPSSGYIFSNQITNLLPESRLIFDCVAGILDVFSESPIKTEFGGQSLRRAGPGILPIRCPR